MGTITESFSNLSDLLLAQKPNSSTFTTPTTSQFLITRWLRPLLPASVHLGTGIVVDLKDRQVGPLDIVGCLEAYPAFGEGLASQFLVDGVLFCMQARDWTVHDLTEFGALATQLKKLESKKSAKVLSAAVSFELLSLEHVSEFLKSPAGQGVDAVLSLGNNLVIRNSQGWYGDPERVPFVTQRGAAEALKSFTFFLIQIAQGAVGLPFGLADYQHL